MYLETVIVGFGQTDVSGLSTLLYWVGLCSADFFGQFFYYPDHCAQHFRKSLEGICVKARPQAWYDIHITHQIEIKDLMPLHHSLA